MIASNELRIGNYVQTSEESNSRIGSVLSIGDKFVKLKLAYSTLKEESFKHVEGLNVDPIPLTEDWLLKFDFSPIGTSSHTEYYSIEDHDFTFSFENGVLVLDNQLNIKLQFVHQLMNLFFALTGTELTIKTESNP